MERLIGLAAQTIRRLAPAALVEVAAAAGFGAVGFPIDVTRWTAADSRSVRAALAATGLVAVDAEVIPIRDRFEPDFARLLDIAAEIGARHVITVSFADDISVTQAVLHEAAEKAQRVGVGIVLEFGPFSRVPTWQAALPLAQAAGTDLLVDPLHLARGGDRAEALRALPPAMLPYAQICDAGPEIAGADAARLLEEARGERLDIGEGVLDLRAFLSVLPPDLPLMNEVRSLAMEKRFPDPLDHARRLAASMRAFLDRREEQQ